MLTKTIGLVIRDYKISMTSPLKFFEDDDLILCFQISEFGASVVNDDQETNLIFPKEAFLFVETSNGIDTVEPVTINGNEIHFRLTSKYTSIDNVGIGRMQIVLLDESSRKALPPFQFEIQPVIHNDYKVYDGLANEDNIALLSEDGMLLDSSSPAYGIKISELPTTTSIDGYIPIVQNGVTKKINLSTYLSGQFEDIRNYVNDKVSNVDNEITNVKQQINEINSTTPKKLSDLENDMNFVTKEYVDTAIKENGGSSGSGNTGGGESGGIGLPEIYVGKNAPDTSYGLWIDNTVQNIIPPTSHVTRLKAKYIEMLSLVNKKLDRVNKKLILIEDNINKISSENADKAIVFRTTLLTSRNKYYNLQSRVANVLIDISGDIDIEIIRTTSQDIRKETKTLVYSLLDFLDEVMRLLDSERGASMGEGGGSGDDNEDTNTTENALLTELGLNILTEDGLLIIANILSTPDDSVLTENGESLLTEDGLLILADGITASEVIVDAILTELGLVILTEDERQILKG
jgi:hypothetical protein